MAENENQRLIKTSTGFHLGFWCFPLKFSILFFFLTFQAGLFVDPVSSPLFSLPTAPLALARCLLQPDTGLVEGQASSRSLGRLFEAVGGSASRCWSPGHCAGQERWDWDSPDFTFCYKVPNIFSYFHLSCFFHKVNSDLTH